MIFAAYNIALFALSGFENGVAFWISYGFMICAFGSWAICGNYLRKKTEQPRDWLFGYPILRHCVIYTVFELIASTVFMIFDDISIGLPLAVQAVGLAVHGVFIVSCFTAKEEIENVQESVRKKVVYIDTLLANIDIIVTKTEDEKLKKELKALREEVRFSDPVSHESLNSLESQITNTINMINSSVEILDIENAHKSCEKALQLLKERNARAKAL